MQGHYSNLVETSPATKGKKIMNAKTKLVAKICLIISAVLCVALIAVHFLDYWTPDQKSIDKIAKEATEEMPQTDAGPISIFKYLILPNDYPTITEYLGTEFRNPRLDPDPVINGIAGTFCIAVLLGAVAVVFVATKPNSRWISLFPFSVGAFTLYGYLTNEIWALGSLHTVLIGISAGITAFAGIALLIWLFSIRYWFMDPKKLKK